MQVWRLALAGLFALFVVPLSGAVSEPQPDAPGAPLRGFKLRHWSVEEGAPSRINAITQSQDGFLWLGGVDGLFRFDGLTFERIGPAPAAPNRIVVARLLAARDGTIWIGLARRRGMLVWRGGKLIDPGMPNPSREVNDIAQGPDGAIWVSRGGRSETSLARWHNGQWTEFDARSGLPEKPVWNPLFARDGTLWLTTEEAVYRKVAGQDRFEPTGIATLPRATLAEGPDGTIWLTEKEQTRAIARAGRLIADGPRFATPFGIRTLFDSQGHMWGATWSDGVFRVEHPERAMHSGRGGLLQRLNTGNGLLSDPVRALFEDREGNIWIGGEMGLNMLRRVPVVTAAGIPSNPATNHMLAADRDGVVYIADDHALYMVRAQADPARVLKSVPIIEAICAAQGEGIWVIQRGRALRLRSGRVQQTFALPDTFAANSCGEDRSGRLWLPALQKGLFVLERSKTQAFAGVAGKDHLPGNVAIMADGRAAIHFRGKMPASAALPFLALTDKSVPSDGVEGLLAGRDTLYTSGAAGLAAPLLRGQPLLSAVQYPWASSLNGIVQTAAGDTWAIGDLGVLRMRTEDLGKALARPGTPLPYRVFDFRDGLASFVQKSSGQQIVAGGDGRIWFATRGNVSSIDPATIRPNFRPPDIVIKGFRTEPDSFVPGAKATIPPGTSQVEIEYTATSLATLDRVRFRYRLQGIQPAWTDAGSRKVAVFPGLGPGTYRFEVQAANEDGVWSTRPAIAEFTIERAFHQTWWFRVLAASAVLGLLYLIYDLRLKQVSGRIRNRMGARNEERERIARELHDTMIQGVQGLILRFQAVADRFADDAAAQALLNPALERAEEMLVEGRERVSGLRRSRVRDFQEELAKLMRSDIYPQDLIAPLSVQRRPRTISDGLFDDLLAVLGEALNNAACHSRASRIEVGLRYGRWEFSAYVRDNGIGMSAEILEKGSPKGHFGVLGMRERMLTIGGKLRVESAEGFGTEIRLTLPAKVAYSSKRVRTAEAFSITL